MSIRKFTSLYEVISDVMRDYREDEFYSELDLASWADDALRLIGVFGQFEHLVAPITINNHKGMLPCGFIEEVQVADSSGCPMYPMSTTMGPIYEVAGSEPLNDVVSPQDDVINSENLTLFGGSKGTFVNNYYFNDNCIITSYEEGFAYISYVGVRSDDQGYPMIPDVEEFLQAIKWYIIWTLLTKKWMAGEDVQQRMLYAEQRWKEYRRKATDQGNMFTLPELENFKNEWVRLIPRMNEFRNFYATVANPERRINHGRIY